MLFTRENARELGRRGNAAKAMARARMAKDLADLLSHAAIPRPDYPAARLSRVRAQLDRLDRLLLTETDPGKLDRLASASLKLSEQEFALAGRPKPGNRRPPPEPTPKRAQAPLPMPTESKPAPGTPGATTGEDNA